MIAFFIDADNFSSPAWVNEAFKSLEMTEGAIAIRRAYGSAENLKGLVDVLRFRAIKPFVNLSLSKNTTDLSLAVDAMELACQTAPLQLIVIGSGDADFVPLVVRLREKGIRVFCVSEKSKMAQDAVPAYDKVIYVGSSSSLDAEVEIKKKTSLTVPSPVQVTSKKVALKKSAAKATTTKSTPAKKVATKKVVAKKLSLTIDHVTALQIVAAVPKFKTGEWLRLGEVAKILHDEKLLAKSVSSTKLFKKHPLYFALTPEKQPNQVRYTPPPK